MIVVSDCVNHTVLALYALASMATSDHHLSTTNAIRTSCIPCEGTLHSFQLPLHIWGIVEHHSFAAVRQMQYLGHRILRAWVRGT